MLIAMKLTLMLIRMGRNSIYSMVHGIGSIPFYILVHLPHFHGPQLSNALTIAQ